jgi:hypothetical protein
MTNFSKLAFMAQRSGQKGREALAVLQDALTVSNLKRLGDTS